MSKYTELLIELRGATSDYIIMLHTLRAKYEEMNVDTEDIINAINMIDRINRDINDAFRY